MKDLIKEGYEFFGKPSLSDTFGGIVFSERVKHDISQKELAKQADVDVEVIYRIEGSSSVEINDLEKVLDCLGVSNKYVGQTIIEHMNDYEQRMSKG